MASAITYRKTRIVCISDTHNTTPPLPKGDILIHAGDLTNQGSLSELRKSLAWITAAPYEAKIIVAGNHDITLDEHFYAEHGRDFHNQHPQESKACVELMETASGVTYLRHEATHVVLRRPDGPRTHFTVFGSPFSPRASVSGNWAFQYPLNSPTATSLWSQIPLDTDIVITHTPPYSHCDTSVTKAPKGCEELRKALWRVRPKVHVCGHLHEGRGVEKVRWKLERPGCAFREEGTEFWDDPGRGEGNRKQSLVDLTGKSRWRLDHVNDHEEIIVGVADGEVAAFKQTDASSCGEKMKALLNSDCLEKAECPGSVKTNAKHSSIGQGDGTFSVDESIRKAIEGRLRRQETCIVNAAFMANSWGGPKRLNKPIVVDIDLPVWQD